MSPLILIFGVLGASFALLIELVTLNVSALSAYDTLTFDFSSLGILIFVAGIEELSKYLFLRQYLLRFFPHMSLNWGQVLSLGLLFGIGFASLEVALALFGDAPAGDALWLVGNTILHSATSIILLSFLRSPRARSWVTSLVPLFLATILHGIYNATLSFWL